MERHCKTKPNPSKPIAAYMSVNIVLPSLSAWATSRITGLMQSKTQSDFDAAFDAILAVDCKITFNGKTLSRDEYKTQLFLQSAAAPADDGAVVHIEDQTEVETGNQGQLSGLVGIFSTMLSDSKFLVLGAPAESQVMSSLHFTIEPTEKNPANPNLHIRGYFDPRRVVAVNQIVSESTYHATLPAVSIPKAATAASSSSKVELGPGPVVIPPHFDSKQHWSLFGGHPIRPVRRPSQ